jgi:hypothetical protein
MPAPIPDWLLDRGTAPPPEEIKAPRGASKLRADLEKLATVPDRALDWGVKSSKEVMPYVNPIPGVAERYDLNTPLDYTRPPQIQPGVGPAAAEARKGQEEQEGNYEAVMSQTSRGAANAMGAYAAQGGLPEASQPGMGGGGGGPVGPMERWKIGPQVRDKFGSAFAASDAAAVGEAKVAAEQAAAMEKMYGAQVADDQARANATQAAEAERGQLLDDKTAEYSAAVKELGDFRIDPQRYWHGKSAPEKMGSIIAIFLSGMAGAMDKSGRNRTVEELNRQRDIDIDAQKSEFGAKEAATRGKQTLFSMAMQRVGDERQAEALAKAAATERIQHEAQRIGAHYKGAEAKARLETTLAGLEMEKAKFLSQAISYEMAGGGGGGGIGAKSGSMDADPKTLVTVGIAEDGTPIQVAARTAEEAAKIDARRSYERQMTIHQNKAIAVLQKYGNSALILGAPGNSELRMIEKEAAPTWSLGKGQGVIQAHEADNPRDAMGLSYGFSDVVGGALGGPNPIQKIQKAMQGNSMGSQSMVSQLTGPALIARRSQEKPNGPIVTRWYPVGEFNGQAMGQGGQPTQQAPRTASERPHKAGLFK